MVRFFGRDKEEKQRQREFREHLELAKAAGKSQGRAMNERGREQIQSLGRAFFLLKDENVLNLIAQYKPELFPIFSSLNPTSKIEKDRDRELFELYLDDVILHEEMTLGDNAEPPELQFLKSLRYYGRFRILDAMQGYRGKLVTEEIERTFVHTTEPKKKGIL